ncbi:uncharacterized protein LOC111035024 [Myzus persicae]|uniref:uncharacterized protein LOC111035024 n=1 Tax=Myzus persicae TaxID=13164 RepID=UPI000B93075D|nr:uncharacterized protein LOC111035024 [Myzus persicae]
MCRVILEEVISPNRRILQNAEIIESPVVREANPDTIIYLRWLYQEFERTRGSGERVWAWYVQARTFARQFNIEFRVLVMLLHDNHYDSSIPQDEAIIQLSFHELMRSAVRIRRHTQYYVIMQFVYGLRRIVVFDSERIREKLEMDWTLNVLTMLSYLDLDLDTSRFILHRIRNLN